MEARDYVINTLEDLAKALNSNLPDVDVDDIIYQNDWRDLRRSSKAIATDGMDIIIKSSDGEYEVIDIDRFVDDLAYTNDLDVVETTIGANGYPKSIKTALIGFKSFDQAETLASDYGMKLKEFYQRDGWSLWQRERGEAYKSMSVDSSYYGDNYECYACSPQEYYKDVVKPQLDNFDNIEELEDFINDAKDIMYELHAAGENETVVVRDGVYYETVEVETMNWNHDSKSYAIGVMFE